MFSDQSSVSGRIRCLLLCGAMTVAAAVMAQGHDGATVASPDLPDWGGLSAFMARVVYFREEMQEVGEAGTAVRIYVNGRLHAALAAGMATVFCLPSGTHVLRSLDDATRALVPQVGPGQVLEGGQTYYFKVAHDPRSHSGAGAAPQASDAAEAAPALTRGADGGGVLSRAGTVVACPAS